MFIIREKAAEITVENGSHESESCLNYEKRDWTKRE
jgi:hypothetical protein